MSVDNQKPEPQFYAIKAYSIADIDREIADKLVEHDLTLSVYAEPNDSLSDWSSMYVTVAGDVPEEIDDIIDDSYTGLEGWVSALHDDVCAVWVNCYNVFDPALPFGGFKQSGWGREMSHNALDCYTETKSVVVKL